MKFISTLVAVAITAIVNANTNANDTTGIFGNAEQWKTGIVKLDKLNNDIFYWMFNSRQETAATDPLVMWLTGGPGCASEVALFFENGPYKFNEDGTLKSNPYSWNEVSNLLFVD